MEPIEESTQEGRDVQLGIDLRERSERLIKGAGDFAQAARSLIKIVKIIIAVFVFLFLIQYATNIVLFLNIRADVQTGEESRNRILDCTQPSGDCYKQGQTQTAQAIGSINQVSILAAACAVEYAKLPLDARIVATGKCVFKHLGEGH